MIHKQKVKPSSSGKFIEIAQYERAKAKHFAECEGLREQAIDEINKSLISLEAILSKEPFYTVEALHGEAGSVGTSKREYRLNGSYRIKITALANRLKAIRDKLATLQTVTREAVTNQVMQAERTTKPKTECRNSDLFSLH